MIVEPSAASHAGSSLAFPIGGFGERLEMHGWLDENCGADGWAMTPAGLRGVINAAVAIYFLGHVGDGLRGPLVRRIEAGDQRRGD
jgi:hypothetical protein